MFTKRNSFTLIELMIALAIFATGVFVILERRNASMEVSYESIQLMKAQRIIDDVLAQYRLYPFSKDPLPIEKDYSPFEVEVDVSEETVSIIPEDWRLDTTFQSEEEKEKERIILRVTIKVKYGTLMDDTPTKEYVLSTLIRHIELADEEDGV